MTWALVVGLHQLDWQLQGVCASLAAVQRSLEVHAAAPAGRTEFLQAYA